MSHVPHILEGGYAMLVSTTFHLLIDSFHMQVIKFRTRFGTSQPPHLINIRQKSGESLRLFIERLRKVEK